MTLTELAEKYLGNRRSVIFEYYGDIERRLRELRIEVETEINPLLIQHGAEPVDPNLAASDNELEDDDDIQYDESGNTWSG